MAPSPQTARPGKANPVISIPRTPTGRSHHAPHQPRRRLSRTRRTTGYTQEALAEHLGVERSTVARWESGETEPQPYIRPKLATALKLSLDELETLLTDTTDDRPAWAIRLQAEREARGWSKYEMARRLFQVAGIPNGNLQSLVRQVRQWENGQHFPRDWRTAYAVAFRMDEEELFGNIDYQTGRRPATLDPLPRGEEDVERRELLEELAALGISITPAARAMEAIRASIGRTFEHSDHHQISHWEEVAVEYGYAYLATPPDRFITDLAVDLVALRLITRDIDRYSLVYKEWCRVGSALSSLMAKTLSNLGHTRDARHWWQTAQTASDSSGDLTARLWVRGQCLIHGLYEQRSPYLLLRHANDAIDLAKGHSCVGLACISGGRAQALVLAGMPDAAEKELVRAEQVFGALPASVANDLHSVHGLGEDGLYYTETWVHAHSGNIAKADNAAQRAMRLYPADDHRSPVQIKLLQAFARTKAGDVTEGIQQAQETYEVLPPGQRTTMITTLADRVLQPIHPDRQEQAPVTAYRELLALSAPQSQKAIES